MHKLTGYLPVRSVLALSSLMLPNALWAEETDDSSPLRVIMAGRDEARNSNLTREGIQGLSSNAADIIMYLCGFGGIALAAFGVFYMWQHLRDGEMSRRSGWRGVGAVLLGGLLTIPAIMAAIAPNAVLGPP